VANYFIPSLHEEIHWQQVVRITSLNFDQMVTSNIVDITVCDHHQITVIQIAGKQQS